MILEGYPTPHGTTSGSDTGVTTAGWAPERRCVPDWDSLLPPNRHALPDARVQPSRGWDGLLPHAPAPQPAWDETTTVEKRRPTKSQWYGGVVQNVSKASVVAQLFAPCGDGFLATIPLESFDETPSGGDEIRCRVETTGNRTRVTASVVREDEMPSLNDLGIDPDELAEWASKLDV